MHNDYLRKNIHMKFLFMNLTKTDYDVSRETEVYKMKWNRELPKEEGWYLCVLEDKYGVRVDDYVWKKDVMYGYLKFDDYADTKVYAWAEFPKWDDENWNEIPHYTDDRNWRDYCPTEDGEYIVKSISGWIPYESKAIHPQHFYNGHWRVYPNQPMNPKYSFVYGWMEFPKPFDIKDKEPIFDYRRAIGVNDKFKEAYKDHSCYVIVGDDEYHETFDAEKGFVREYVGNILDYRKGLTK